jgi:hypothetical protein
MRELIAGVALLGGAVFLTRQSAPNGSAAEPELVPARSPARKSAQRKGHGPMFIYARDKMLAELRQVEVAQNRAIVLASHGKCHHAMRSLRFVQKTVAFWSSDESDFMWQIIRTEADDRAWKRVWEVNVGLNTRVEARVDRRCGVLAVGG